jgi:hypothetical protein
VRFDEGNKLVDDRVGDAVANDPAVAFGPYRVVGAQKTQRLRDGVGIVVHGHGQVRDADGAGGSNAAKEAESGGVAQKGEPFRPFADAGWVETPDGLTDFFLVDDSPVSPVGGDQVHGASLP